MDHNIRDRDDFYDKFYSFFAQLADYENNNSIFSATITAMIQLLEHYTNSPLSETDKLKPLLFLIHQKLDVDSRNGVSKEEILRNLSWYVKKINDSREARETMLKTVVHNTIKSGVDLVFVQYPILEKIGTKAEYSAYLDTIFPESKVRYIVYHRTYEKFDVFDKSKITETNCNRFYFSPINTGRYGNHVIQAILNIKNLAVPYDNNFINDVNRKHPEYTKGKNKWFHLPAQIYINADKYGYDGVYAFEGTNNDEYSVYLPEQIHILGSKQDIEGFRRFISQHRN